MMIATKMIAQSVKVFYATDRQATGDQTLAKRYGNKRSKDECLAFGTYVK